jgi:sulfate permease, SulP family
VAGDVCPDRVRGSDGGGGSRDDSGGSAVHQPGGGGDHRLTGDDDYIEDGRVHILQDKDIPYYVSIFRIHGPFLFGATEKISAVTENMHALPPVVVLRLRNMTALDATGLFAIEEVARALQATGRTMILCGAREQPAKMLHEAEFEEVIGKNNICDNVQEAMQRAQDVFEKMEAKASVGSRAGWLRPS